MDDLVAIKLDPRENAGAALWKSPRRVIAIAVGGQHNLLLTEDGEVHACGANEAGQCDVPAGLTGVIAIGAGYRHSIAVRGDGTVQCWGDNETGQLDVPEGLVGVRSVTGGVCHTAALTVDGSVFSWGLMKTREPHVPPVGLERASAIASGWWGTYAVADANLVVWGTRAEFGPVTERPVLVGGSGASTRVVSVAVRHDPFGGAIVALADGTVMEDSRGDGAFYNFPTEDLGFGETRRAIQVTAGSMHRLALLDDGTVVGWGGSPVRERPPVGLNSVVAVEAGSDHSLALRADGSVVAWGKNGHGQLHAPEGYDGESVPWNVSGYYLRSLGASPPTGDPYHDYGPGAAPSGARSPELLAQGIVDEAERLLARGDSDGAVAKYVAALETGSLGPAVTTFVQVKLGSIFGLRGDHATAARWYTPAAEAGDAAAMSHLGYVLYAQGKTADGVRWLTRSAEAGHVRGMALLGVLLLQQVQESSQSGRLKGQEERIEQSWHWLKRAADAGDTEAQKFVGTASAYRTMASLETSTAQGGGEKQNACYIATAVYGSDSAAQVETLRRFRDDSLARSVAGRAFIRSYYTVSPSMARYFAGATPLNRLGRTVLDAAVRRLEAKQDQGEGG